MNWTVVAFSGAIFTAFAANHDLISVHYIFGQKKKKTLISVNLQALRVSVVNSEAVCYLVVKSFITKFTHNLQDSQRWQNIF